MIPWGRGLSWRSSAIDRLKWNYRISKYSVADKELEIKKDRTTEYSQSEHVVHLHHFTSVCEILSIIVIQWNFDLVQLWHRVAKVLGSKVELEWTIFCGAAHQLFIVLFCPDVFKRLCCHNKHPRGLMCSMLHFQNCKGYQTWPLLHKSCFFMKVGSEKSNLQKEQHNEQRDSSCAQHIWDWRLPPGGSCSNPNQAASIRYI